MAARLVAIGVLPVAIGCSRPSPCVGERCLLPDADLDRDASAPPVISNDGGMTRVVTADAACASQAIRAEPGTRRPVDIIFVIDNSGSMADEISAVRHNIDKDFASIIEASGVDYRVIMLSRYGQGGTTVCIDPPLAGNDCNAGLDATNGPRYFHYNQEIGSHDALCQILDTLDRAESPQRAPRGFQAWLRPEAAKAFVVVTDDAAACSYRDEQREVIIGAEGTDPFEDAIAFHGALREKSPALFGGGYQFFSIVGFGTKSAEPETLFPQQALAPMTCNTAPSAGLVYQALSVATDALRYPVCEGRSFDAVFQVLARSVIQTATAECTYQIPEVPAPDVIILPSVNLQFRADTASAMQPFSQVSDAAACRDDHSFYIRDRIELCPDACRVLQRAADPQVDISYGCARAPD